MKKYFLVYLLICCYCIAPAQQDGLTFHTPDQRLQTAFDWAKATALSYKGKPGDPVGDWYESALPPRAAFCMRDVSHQSLGAQVLGLSKENKNMLSLFVQNISESKDWCSYWEINHLGKPAPADYRNDREFWYNLNANFDVLNACWKLYLWTGDKDYIQGPAFRNFHDRSANDYIDSWVLQVDSLLTRPAHPNAPLPFNPTDDFHRCRGLPSYSEGVPNMKMGVDLVAAIYRGLMAYAGIQEVNGQPEAAARYRAKAIAYQRSIDSLWWDEKESLYYTFYSNNYEFGKQEGETFLLWFDALTDTARKQQTIRHLLSKDWNVENLSYFPLIMYENGYWEKAAGYMLHLSDPETHRREYPEVSYGVIKGFTEGLMGIAADARFDRVSTLYRYHLDQPASMDNVPVLQTVIKVEHNSKKETALTNKGKQSIQWQVKFSGAWEQINVNGKRVKAVQEKDAMGNTISWVTVPVRSGKKVKTFVL